MYVDIHRYPFQSEHECMSVCELACVGGCIRLVCSVSFMSVRIHVSISIDAASVAISEHNLSGKYD